MKSCDIPSFGKNEDRNEEEKRSKSVERYKS
jgi:hypothetical protein